MAFKRIPMGKGKEQTVAPEGTYSLVVRKFEEKTTKKGDPMFVATIGFDGQPEFATFREYITLPGKETSEDQAAMRIRNLARFLTVFGVEFDDDGFDTDAVQGAVGECPVAVEVIEGQNGDFETNRLRLPRVAEEA